MSHSPYLQVALQAVKEAEKIINQYYSNDIRLTLKPDQSPVTLADQEAEQVIRRVIQESFPNHSILGEEGGGADTESEFLWIIDPIDGTKNYVRQVPLFATQLALMQDGEIILGVSNAPAMGELMYAQKGQGSFFNGEPVHVSKVQALNESYLSYGSLFCFSRLDVLDGLLRLENDTRAHRGFGDAWSYHLLAQGKIDIVAEGSVKIWDIAAASLIVEEAGGQMTDLQGRPITKNTTSVLATNGHLHDEVLSYFA